MMQKIVRFFQLYRLVLFRYFFLMYILNRIFYFLNSLYIQLNFKCDLSKEND